MRVFLVDAENVNLDMFIKSREFRNNDKFYLVGYSSLKFGIEVLKFLENREYFVYKFDNPSENYADKIIFTILGFIMNEPKFSEFYIVSNDNIFINLAYTEKLFSKKVENIKFSNSTSLVRVEKTKPLAKESQKEQNKNSQNDKPKDGSKDSSKNSLQKQEISNDDAYIKEIFEKHKSDILILKKANVDKNEFHNTLVKIFGMEIGKQLYKLAKFESDSNETPSDFYNQNRAKIDKIIKENSDLKELHNALQKEFGKDGTEVYKYLKDGGKI